MAKIDDKQIGVARVYSQALLGLAERRGVADEVHDELAEIVKLGESDPRFSRFIESPLVDPEDREKTLEKLFRGRVADVLVDALQIMNRKGRLAILPAMAQLYHEEHAALRGRVEVHVTSVVELAESAKARLRKGLGAATGREVGLVERVDESLIGGLVVQVGDQKYDGSVRRNIENRHDTLAERARQEIYKSRAAQEG